MRRAVPRQPRAKLPSGERQTSSSPAIGPEEQQIPSVDLIHKAGQSDLIIRQRVEADGQAMNGEVSVTINSEVVGYNER